MGRWRLATIMAHLYTSSLRWNNCNSWRYLSTCYHFQQPFRNAFSVHANEIHKYNTTEQQYRQNTHDSYTHTCVYAIYDRGHSVNYYILRGHLLPSMVFSDIPANSILYNSHLIIAGCIFKLICYRLFVNMMITYWFVTVLTYSAILLELPTSV